MSGPNIGCSIAELDNSIHPSLTHNGSWASGNAFFLTSADCTAASDGEVIKQTPVVEQILHRDIPRLRTEVSKESANNRWAQHREAALPAREVLLRDREVHENLGDDAPEISAARLHVWTWSGTSSLWSSGHNREALVSAARKFNAGTRNKVDRRDVSEKEVWKQVSLFDTAKPGKARLRREPLDDSDTYRSVQCGAMALAEGIFAGIRNPPSHEADVGLDERTVPEHLTALSAPARWVDEAEFERVEEIS